PTRRSSDLLKDLTRKIAAGHVLDLVEVTGRTVVGPTIQVRLFGGVNQVLLWIGIRSVEHLPRLKLECRRRSCCLRHRIDEMAGCTADAFDLNLAGQDLTGHLVHMLR